MRDTKELIDALNKTASSLEELAQSVETTKTASMNTPANPEKEEYMQGILNAMGLDD